MDKQHNEDSDFIRIAREIEDWGNATQEDLSAWMGAAAGILKEHGEKLVSILQSVDRMARNVHKDNE